MLMNYSDTSSKLKPSAAKGTYMKSISCRAHDEPGIRIDAKNLTGVKQFNTNSSHEKRRKRQIIG
jgi:hypothetical protein